MLPWPLLNFNSDEGLGYGVRVLLINRGEGEKPYRLGITGQFFQTTNDVFLHLFRVDAPQLLGTKWRVNLDLSYEGSRFAQYYGQGNGSVFDPRRSTCEDRAALLEDPDVCPGNPDFVGLRYYVYERRTLPRIALMARRPLVDPWKLFGGYRLQFVNIRPMYPLKDLGQTADSRLVEDAKAGLLVGYDGQSTEPFNLRSAELIAGIIYDTRDNEPAPGRGMFHEASLRVAAPVIGSQFLYWGLNANLRLYVPVVPGYDRLTAAFHGLLDITGGDVPFYQLASFGGLGGYETGVGGVYTVRGIRANRYQGKEKLVLNGELRWRFVDLKLLGQDVAFTAVTGADVGRSWRDIDFNDVGGLHAGATLGLRLAWNRDLVVRFDYGAGLTEPTSGFYIEFGNMF